MELKPLVQVYDEYFKCGTPSCFSIYHISNFNAREFECRDCKKTSEVPKEANPRFRPKKRDK